MAADANTSSPLGSGMKPDMDTRGLRLTEMSAAGAALGLKPGDKLIAFNGLAFRGDAKLLYKRLRKSGAQFAALTFRRGENEWNVLSNTIDPGRWGVTDPPPDTDRAPVDPRTLDNYELFMNHKREYDLQTLSPSNLAILMTPLWLVQMRLWTPLAIISSAVAMTLPIGAWLGISVYALASVYVWRSARELFRADRVAHGFLPFAVIAANSEAVAHRTCADIAPGLKFAYSGAPGASMTTEYDFEEFEDDTPPQRASS